MSCYHPLLGTYYADSDTGERKVKVSPLIVDEGLGKSVKLSFEDIKKSVPDAFLVPCGKCIGCRLDYSRRWADRMLLELESYQGKAVFLTLTYDDDHLVDKDGNYVSGYGSLYVRHLQLFMKRLRRAHPGVTLRFFGVGEYGSWENTHRPHYHVVLYGLGLDDLEDKVSVGFNELKQPVYTSRTISDYWPHGFISVGDVSWRSCAYVARYVTKKSLEPESDLLNEMFGLNPLFSVMSRRPGIGRPYLDAHPDCLDYQSIFVSTDSGSRKISIPRYFVNSLKLTDSDKYDTIVAQRALYANDSMMSKLSQTDLPLLDYLEVEEVNICRKIASLKRSL